MAASSRPEPMSTTTGTAGSRPARSGDADLGGEAGDAVVRRVHLEHQRHLVEDPPVVVQPGAVGRPDLDEAGPRLLEHLGDAEPPTDLDQLAPAHRHPPVPGQRGQHEHHGGRAVVHDQRRLRPGRPGQERRHPFLARASLTGLEVELEVGVRGPLGADLHRGPPEVGVEEDAGGVDHRLQEAPAEGGGTDRRRSRVAGGDGGAGRVHQQRVGEARGPQRPGQCVDRRGPLRHDPSVAAGWTWGFGPGKVRAPPDSLGVWSRCSSWSSSSSRRSSCS